MNLMSLKVFALSLGAAVLCMTSSCTSKSEHASTQQETTVNDFAKDPLQRLKDGNERFVNGKMLNFHQDSLRVKELANSQQPEVVIISCSDSRVTPEIVFDQGLGDVFTIRTAGNVMDSYEEGSIEYAVDHLNAKLIVVMGHTHCGAIHAMLETHGEEHAPGHIDAIVEALKHGVKENTNPALSHDSIEYYTMLTNVENGVNQLKSLEPILKEKYAENNINIIGAVYDVETGKVNFFEF